MRSRRVQDHHAEALRRRRRLGRAALAGAVLALVVGWPAEAGTWAIDRAGRVHHVEVDQTGDASSGTIGTAIVYHVRNPDGTVDMTVLPGTADAAIDRDPTLDLDPVDEQPLVVWSRGTEGAFGLVVSRLEAGVWTPPVPVPGTDDGADHLAPSVRIRSNLAHVVWRRDGASAEWLRASLRRTTLGIAFGPEWLPTRTDHPISADGGAEPSADAASPDLTYFATSVDAPDPEDPSSGTVIVWGIRDEPLPITYARSFRLPADAKNVTSAGAEWRQDRFLVWALAGASVRYAILDGEVWSDFRAVPSEAHSGVPGALDLVEEMLIREREGALPD